MSSRPDAKTLIGKKPAEVPMSLQRILERTTTFERSWVGPKEAAKISADDQKACALAHDIMKHLCVSAPLKHKSGHPGGPLSAFTFAYEVSRRRKPGVDAPLHYSAGHLSLLAYGLQWMFHKEGKDERLASPQAIIDTFRIPSGLPGHVEAGIGDIPFGTGPLGKGTSVALGRALGMRFLKHKGVVDVVLADGDSQEGQVMEAFRLASHLKLDNLMVHGDWNDVQLSDEPSKTVAADFAKIAEAAGWRVIEVQNGNDLAQVRAALDLADSFVGKGAPIFLCYYTTMGSGIAQLEEGVNTGKANYHGSPLKEDMAQAVLKDIAPLDELVKEYEKFRKEMKAHITNEPKALDPLEKATRTITAEKSSARSEFGSVHIKALMSKDPRIVVLHADLAGSGGFDKVAKEFPDRVINVGVAEGNMIMMAAGLRQAGMLPITYTFAAFATNEGRASARLIDVNCGHTHCSVFNDATHAGLSVGENGETHQERHYLNVPFDHTQVWMPVDSNQTAAAAERGLNLVADGKTSVYCFFPRSSHEQIKTPKGEIVYDKDYQFD
jgi:transketolase